MKITREPTGERQLSLTIEVEEEQVKRARKRVAREISREVTIPGFRRGRAPYDVVVQRLGPGVVREELVNTLAQDVYREALEQEDISPYAPGTLEETQFDPLRLTFTVPLAPQVDLGDYRDYRRSLSVPNVSDEAVNDALGAIQEQNAILAPLDRPAAEGDVLVVELIGRTTDGTEFVHEEEASIRLDPEAREPVPGLIDALLGIAPGEERTFTLVLPIDFELKELQATPAEFVAEAKSVYERIVPELDDDLARTVGNYDTFEELRNDVRQRLLERRRTSAEKEYAEQVLQDLIDQAVVSFPPVMLEEALDDAVEAYGAQIERRERMLLEDYLRIQSKTMEGLRMELSDEVEQSLRRSLLLREVVQLEGLAVSEEELDAQIAESSERYGERAEDVRAALSEPDSRLDLRSRMLADKAVHRLVSIARGEHTEAEEDEDAPSEMEETQESQD